MKKEIFDEKKRCVKEGKIKLFKPSGSKYEYDTPMGKVFSRQKEKWIETKECSTGKKVYVLST